ncbi:MAG: hypothetical protein ABIQ44_03770 [Chloroflexia bacterium]
MKITSKCNKRDLPKCKPFIMTDPFYRWRADITRRYDSGAATGSWYLEEMSELQDIVEQLNWDTIIKIEIYRIPLPGLETLTVEQSMVA